MPGIEDPRRRRFVKHIVAGSIAANLAAPVLAQATPARRALRIVHITDMHLDTRPVAIANVTKVLKEINALKEKPDLIINTGDSVFRADGKSYEEAKEQWELLTQLLAEHNRIPMRSCIGNHDVWFGPDAQSNDRYRSHKLFHKQWVLDVLANTDADHPHAAFLIMNDPVKREKEIAERVKQGFMIRTRSDADTREARTGDKKRFEAAIRSGAQVITTDYYLGSLSPNKDFEIVFDGKYSHCNPVLRGEGCELK